MDTSGSPAIRRCVTTTPAGVRIFAEKGQILLDRHARMNGETVKLNCSDEEKPSSLRRDHRRGRRGRQARRFASGPVQISGSPKLPAGTPIAWSAARSRLLCGGALS
jgi:hypothetical protein